MKGSKATIIHFQVKAVRKSVSNSLSSNFAMTIIPGASCEKSEKTRIEILIKTLFMEMKNCILLEIVVVASKSRNLN